MMSAKALIKMSMLTAVSLILFVIELRIPELVPISGVKLGLANIVTVWAVYSCSTRETILMVSARILLGSIFCGTALSFIYSLCGATFSLLVSLFLKNVISSDHLWLNSIVGAIFHNIGQILAAMLVMHTKAILVYLPILMLSGIISGAFCGIAAETLYKKIHMLR